MANSWSELAGKLASLAGKWTAYTAFGSFLLYLVGYLTLRFQLSTYGVVTDLDAFDEKYLFAGSRFLVYFVASVPNVLLIMMVALAVAYLPYRLVPASAKARLTQWGAAWIAPPERVALLGTALTLAMIQFVLRKCFVFGNLLLAPQLPEDEWINAILLGNPADRSLYFSGLVGGTLLTGGVLLLVNYGILIASQDLPRVSELGDAKLAAGDQNWLVWEGKAAVTYLSRVARDGRRSLITIPRKEPRITIVAYDNIFRALFAPPQPGATQVAPRGGSP